MKSVYSGYVRMVTDGIAYFAGANTADGFRGLYDGIADERRMERVYILKGGPGTWKSTLIRKAVPIRIPSTARCSADGSPSSTEPLPMGAI